MWFVVCSRFWPCTTLPRLHQMEGIVRQCWFRNLASLSPKHHNPPHFWNLDWTCPTGDFPILELGTRTRKESWVKQHQILQLLSQEKCLRGRSKTKGLEAASNSADLGDVVGSSSACSGLVNKYGKRKPLKLPFVFSGMRSKGSRFTLGVWGFRVCSLDVAQPSATVCVDPVWPCLW